VWVVPPFLFVRERFRVLVGFKGGIRSLMCFRSNRTIVASEKVTQTYPLIFACKCD